MSDKILDGIYPAKRVRSQIRRKLKKLAFTPGLAIIQVGKDPASTLYIKHKRRDCEKVNFRFEELPLPATIHQDDLIANVEALNARTDIHGIMVQMPLPEGIDKEAVIDKISPQKDADGLHPVNLGNLLINREDVTPCTPTGIIRLIELTGEQIEGKHAVCIGRSPLVGKSAGLMLLNRNATVTYCHSRTVDLTAEVQKADILIAAVGRPGFVTADMVKPGAIVIDVGINYVNGHIVGDVKFEEVKEVAGFITPVPGGVGPMTRAMLLENTLKLAIGG